MSRAAAGSSAAAPVLVAQAAPSSPPQTTVAAADTAAQTGTADAELQEVVVTAERRQEDISKVPISITAMSQSTIDNLGIKNFSDMAAYTPGVTIDTDRTQQIAIRGVASNGGADTTGIYIDDTPIQTRTDIDALPEAFDIDRIEVLRGPQGTLFGAGAEGGAVRYITTQPSLTQSSIYSRDEMSYTQGGALNYEYGIAGGVPVIDGVFGVRVAALVTHQGGWIDDVDSESPTAANPSQNIVDSNANRSQQEMFRITALWQPSDDWQITPQAYYQIKNQNDATVYWPIYSDPGQDRYYDGTPDRNPTSDDWFLPSLKIQHNLGFAELISDSSYFDRETSGSLFDGTLYNLGFYQVLAGDPEPGGAWGNPNFPVLNGTGIHLPAGMTYIAPSPSESYFHNYTQEVRLQSNQPNSKLQWTVGGFYELDQQIDQDWILAPDDTNFFQTLANESVVDVFGEPLSPNPTASWFSWENQYTRQYALYADAAYAFTSQWKLDVGLRESWIEYSFDEVQASAQEFGPPDIASGENKQPSFTPKVNLNFQADPDDLYYFTYAKGFRPGGANAPIPEAACSTDFHNLGLTSTPVNYNSDTTDSFELGAKNNIAQRVQLASSVYWINWNNIQQFALLPTCGLGFIDNLGTAVSKGVDLQGDFRVTESLTVDLAAGYTEARYTNASKISPNVTQPITEPGDAIEDATGGPVPPFSGTLGFEYRFNAFTHQVFFRVDDQYTGAPKWIGAGEDPRTSLYDPDNFLMPSQNQINLRTGLIVKSWELDAFVDNLADAHPLNYYEYSINPGNGTSRLEEADTFRPRTMGLTFIFRK